MIKSIPKNLIIFRHNKDIAPSVIADAIDVTKRTHFDYKFIYADDEYMHEFIKKNFDQNALKLYQNNKIPASRADMARLYLLYVYGGIYVDSSMEFYRTMNDLIQDGDVYLLSRDDVYESALGEGESHVANGIICAIPEAKYIGRCIEVMTQNLISKRFNYDVWNATGPGVLNRVCREGASIENIKKISFKCVLQDYINYRRNSKGMNENEKVVNQWVRQQKNGIYDICYMPCSRGDVMQEQFPRLSLEATFLAMRQRTRLWLMASDEYYRIAKQEYERIGPFMPSHVDSVLDIGAGLGGYHIYLNKHFDCDVKFHFIDRNKVDEEMKFGYRKSTEAYNSFSITKEVLSCAGVSQEQMVFWDADENGKLDELARSEIQFDVIISLYSWGFHYPISNYLELVYELIKPEGILIIDVRGVPEQEELLFSKFDIVDHIDMGQTNNSRRLCLKKIE